MVMAGLVQMPHARAEGYTVPMDRIVDQTILGILCLLLVPLTALSGAYVVALLTAIVVACCFELHVRAGARIAASGAYVVAALVFPDFTLFLPVVAYGMSVESPFVVRFAWVVPLAASLRTGDYLMCAATGVLCVAACFMSWRATRMIAERERFCALRDSQQEASLALAQKNRDLLAAQDYEVRLATLSERSRIAREIHDNVGHLLTRSIMQVEALQVVHANDEQVRDELAAVGATLHEAMDTVRASVHDLHDDAFDLRSRLEGVIGACELADVRLVFDAQNVPLPAAYAVVAVVREALSNVARHSDATRVDVSLVEYPALFQLVVQDNGSPPANASVAPDGTVTLPQDYRGMGLHTMDERITTLGGRLRVLYRKGFRVFATIPKNPKEERS